MNSRERATVLVENWRNDTAGACLDWDSLIVRIGNQIGSAGGWGQLDSIKDELVTAQSNNRGLSKENERLRAANATLDEELLKFDEQAKRIATLEADLAALREKNDSLKKVRSSEDNHLLAQCEKLVAEVARLREQLRWRKVSEEKPGE